jgi:hypothetical protein
LDSHHRDPAIKYEPNAGSGKKKPSPPKAWQSPIFGLEALIEDQDELGPSEFSQDKYFMLLKTGKESS